MTLHCALCKGFICRGGVAEAAPENCPMRGDFPVYDDLYPPGEIRHLIACSAMVEAKGYCQWTRLREVAEFARLMELERVGIAHCPDMAREAEQVRGRLENSGLSPLLPPPATVSDPEGQAAFFTREGTGLNLLAGMCVAHEAIFLQATETTAVSLIARDTRLHHNPAAGLYTSRSYLQDELFGHWPLEERPSYRGAGVDVLEGVAEDPSRGGEKPRSRIAEAMDVAHAIGASHIGVSFCVGFREEAKTLTRILETNGFRVSSVCCKTGAVPKERAGIADAQKVRPGKAEMICNPVAQAELLNREEAEFVLVLGQCVGHDAATLRHLNAPAACLVAKDRVLAHNTVAALQIPWNRSCGRSA